LRFILDQRAHLNENALRRIVTQMRPLVQFERRNDFTVALQLLARHGPELAMVAAAHRAWFPALTKDFIEGILA
jgi:hypothetical protein